LQEVRDQLFEFGVLAGDRLFHAGDRPGFHQAERDGHFPGVRGRAADNDRHRLRLHDAARRLEAVHARHVDVHEHHVGPVLVDEIQRGLAVGDGADDTDLRI